MATRAIMTLYRASMSAMGLSFEKGEWVERGYRFIVKVHNTTDDDFLDQVDVRLTYQSPNGPQTVMSRIAGSIPPRGTGEVSWDVPSGDAVNGYLDASGLFRRTPDMGYARISCNIAGVHELPNEKPDQLINPEVLYKWDGTWSIRAEVRAEGQTHISEGGVMEIRVEDMVPWIRWIKAPSQAPDGPSIEEYGVTQGGRCLVLNERNPNGPERMDTLFCMNQGGGSFSGWTRHSHVDLEIQWTGVRILP